MAQPIRVRFAPSPTGYLHVGGARTALYNYLFARHHGGKFILRVEDTDQARSTDEAMRMQLADLQWLGIEWDEGPTPDGSASIGDYGPYRQSERLVIYKEKADQLLAEGKAFYCFCTDDELEAKKQKALAEGRPPQYDGTCRHLAADTVKERLESGQGACVRFQVPNKSDDYVIQDLVRGEVRFPASMVGDFVILRSDGMPVYNFCCVVDDALMEISHVFRAEEHLSNTLRQYMIYEALGWKIPQFGHMSIILGKDRQKLSKRHGATSCNDFRERGFLPEAMNNFIALLGWSSPKGQEIITPKELVEQFDGTRLNPAAAVFDETKLQWVNASHLRGLPPSELWQRIEPFLNEAGLQLPGDSDWRNRALEVFKTSMETLADAPELFRPLCDEKFQVTAQGQEALSWESSKAVVEAWMAGLEQRSGAYLSEADFEELQSQIKQTAGVKGKFLFQPIRVAVIGHPQGAELKVLVPLMKKSSLLQRAEKVLRHCS